MITERPYREPMSHAEALDELLRGAARSSTRTW